MNRALNYLLDRFAEAQARSGSATAGDPRLLDAGPEAHPRALRLSSD
jgi:hypothetical protein